MLCMISNKHIKRLGVYLTVLVGHTRNKHIHALHLMKRVTIVSYDRETRSKEHEVRSDLHTRRRASQVGQARRIEVR